MNEFCPNCGKPAPDGVSCGGGPCKEAERLRGLAKKYKAVNVRLLAALEEMVDMMDSGDEPGAGNPWHIKAKQAIREARKGEAKS